MYEILQEYSPTVQRFSIDECFADLAGCAEDAAYVAHTAYIIKERIKKELGFTVNVGVGSNKLLAKMAGELQKPDKVHTLLNRREIEEKLWPLPVGELFMAGRASVKKLKGINIRTIGELANSDVFLLRRILKSHGQLLWEYANGIDRSQVIPNQYIVQKGFFTAQDSEKPRTAALGICQRNRQVTGDSQSIHCSEGTQQRNDTALRCNESRGGRTVHPCSQRQSNRQTAPSRLQSVTARDCC